MATVRTILSPLFPSDTFADGDQAFVERRSVPVGPIGGQVRSIAESIWPAEDFADTDLIVVETGRHVMSDVLLLPGDVLVDEFNRAAGSPADLLAFGDSVFVCDGAGSLAIPMSRTYRGPVFLNRRPAAGSGARLAWTNAATNGFATSSLVISKAEDTARFNVRMEAAGSSVICHDVVFSSDTQQSFAYSPTMMKHWRIRVLDRVYYETSGDGVTWTTRKTRPKQPWQDGACVYSIQVGAWSDNGLTAGTTLVDRFALGL